MKGWVVAVLVGLSMAPLAAAEPPAATFTAERATVLGGSATVGDLTIFAQENTGPQDVRGSPLFHLEATTIRAVSDHTNASVSAAGVGQRTDPYTTTKMYHDAVVSGVEHRSGYRFLVFPEGEVDVSISAAACSRIDASQETTFQRSAEVRNDHEPDKADTQQSVLWSSCTDAAAITLHGDFLLRLWEWDAELESREGSATLTSGRQAMTPLPKSTAYEATEQFLYATNATLHVPSLEGYYRLYLEGLAAASASSIQFHDAALQVGDVELAGQTIQAYGVAGVVLGSNGNGLAGSLASLTEAAGDGDAWLASTTAAAAPASSWPWAWVVAAAIGAVVVVRGRRIQSGRVPSWLDHRAAAWAKRAKDAYGRRRDVAAIAWARFSLLVVPNTQAHIVRARSYARLGYTAPALRVHRRLHDIFEGERRQQTRNAWYAFQAAAANRPEQALQWLAIARDRDSNEFLRLTKRHPVDPTLVDVEGHESRAVRGRVALG